MEVASACCLAVKLNYPSRQSLLGRPEYWVDQLIITSGSGLRRVAIFWRKTIEELS